MSSTRPALRAEPTAGEGGAGFFFSPFCYHAKRLWLSQPPRTSCALGAAP